MSTSSYTLPLAEKPAWHAALTPALRAFATYWPAILGIQLVALGIVLSYFLIDETASLFALVSNWKTRGGLLFSAVATIISGGIIPELLKRVFRPSGITVPSAGELCHQFIMWALVGMLVDLFYQAQNQLFGQGADALTLLIKVLVDQFLFSPLISLPLITLWFMLREARYQPKRFFQNLKFRTLRDRVLPLWATSLCFWPIMLCIVFSLPATLQFPLFLLGNAAFSILMIFIIRRQNTAADTSIDN